MKTSIRRRLGTVMLGLSVVGPIGLALSGVGSRVESLSETHGDTIVNTATVHVESPLWVNIGSPCAAGIGLLLLVWPRRDTTDASRSAS